MRLRRTLGHSLQVGLDSKVFRSDPLRKVSRTLIQALPATTTERITVAAADGKVLAVQTKQARLKAPRLDVLRRGAFCFPAANFSLVRYAFIQVQSAPESHPEKLLVLERLKKLPIALTPNLVIHRQNIGELRSEKFRKLWNCLLPTALNLRLGQSRRASPFGARPCLVYPFLAGTAWVQSPYGQKSQMH